MWFIRTRMVSTNGSIRFQNGFGGSSGCIGGSSILSCMIYNNVIVRKVFEPRHLDHYGWSHVTVWLAGANANANRSRFFKLSPTFAINSTI